jgi:hypothetical protein
MGHPRDGALVGVGSLCPVGVVGTISMLEKRQENQGQKRKRHTKKFKNHPNKTKRRARLPYKGLWKNAHNAQKKLKKLKARWGRGGVRVGLRGPSPHPLSTPS